MEDIENERNWRSAVWIALLSVFAAQIYLAIYKSLNWDEFFHFHHIYEMRSGAVGRTLQVLYIRYFDWLFDLPLIPFDQLRVGRIVILFFEVITVSSIFGIVKRFASAPVAALCALGYMTAGFVFSHIFAFRADPQATALLMAALWLFCTRDLRPHTIIVAGALVGIAGMITVKSAFYAPVFIGAFAWRWRHSEAKTAFLLHCVGIGVSAILVFGLLYVMQSSTANGSGTNAGVAELKSAGNAVFADGLLPRLEHLIRQIGLAPIFAALCIAAPFMWKKRLADSSALVMFTGFMSPMLTLLFYRNSYPYYFVFLLAPAAIVVFPAVEWMARRYSVKIVAAAFVFQAAVLTVAEQSEITATQRDTELLVRELFPQPVVYVDFCGMIGNFPRVFPFLTSGWGLKDYRAKGEPLLVAAMERAPVPFVIANHRVIYAALKGHESEEALLSADAAALRENYIHHRGPVWLAGKTIAAGEEPVFLEMRIPGVYTVENAVVRIEGIEHPVGSHVTLARGTYRIGGNRVKSVILRWGATHKPPSGPIPVPPYFSDY